MIRKLVAKLAPVIAGNVPVPTGLGPRIELEEDMLQEFQVAYD